ncbi:phosphoenolpyruvate--protein phosphotransferase [Halopelagius longus]|uniref:Phosphoenolpyruvate-protein phosphotransferase n=1 Tax=Halopelagius longus TaxID=1236180 RepID=A0A1H1AQJ4_9EURY|nr:phosphoenolpyruvate--protein phosphotransferase [Halopelagius longus]RDI70479.1 phosphoenolpyruvate--protein phosphotransferase [Halopelagius longus]SDQ41995.1 phosphoenolpyruvate--protein phosphotransferase [Halopelagius longus]
MTERRIDGIGVTPLSGVGTVVWYSPDAELDDPPEPDSVDTEAETARFEDARTTAREELKAERERTAERVGEDEAAVFDAHVQFLDDPQITDGVSDRIEGGLPAEHAVSETFAEFIEQFEGMEGRMAERADDLRDVRDRLVRVLSGGERVNLGDLPEGSVVLAERLTPSDTAQLDPSKVAGFVTVAGGRTSHAAIFARSLALPAVVGVGDELHEVEDGTDVVVNGTDGVVTFDPDEETREAAAGGDDADIRDEPVSTADGTEIEVAANVGTRKDLGPATERGADGIGLYRTEFLFLDRESPPDEEEQYEAYVEALDAFPEGRVVVRTLDVGGDKPIDYLDLPEEENPFLGERGIRRSLGPDSDLFETQLRALLRAAGSENGEGLAVMLPLVATVEEVRAARETMDEVAADLDDEGVEYARPEFGVMVETPAAAFVADELVEHVEFFSIGTNDLAQYVMAAERGNERVSELGDYRQPAVLRAIRATVEATEGTDAWVGMCGEMAGDPDLTTLLLGLGLDELSMSAVTVPQVKEAVTETTLSDARALAEDALEAGTKDEVQRVLTNNIQQ